MPSLFLILRVYFWEGRAHLVVGSGAIPGSEAVLGIAACSAGAGSSCCEGSTLAGPYARSVLSHLALCHLL